MKEQVLRILRMVQDGRLSPEDAYELMAAFVNFDGGQSPAQGQAPSEQNVEGKSERADPFKRLMDSVEKMTKEGLDAVDWKSVAQSIQDATKRGVESLKARVEQLSKRDFRLFWTAALEEATVELPLHAEKGKKVRIELTHGKIDIRGGHAVGSLKAVAQIGSKSYEEAREKADRWTPIIEEHDGNLTIRQSGDTISEKLELRLPEGVAVEIHTENGDVEVQNTKAPLRLTSISGDVEAKGLAGAVEINATSSDVELSNIESANVEIEVKSGDITLSHISGNIKARTASGNVRGKNLAGRTLSVETVNGDVDLDICKPHSGALNVRTVNGDVLVDLASGSNCRVALSSLSGKVQCDFDLEDERRDKQRVTGQIGTGEGTVDISTVKGDVCLSLRDHFQ